MLLEGTYFPEPSTC